MYEILEHLFRVFIQFGIMALEVVGVIIILISAIRALTGMLQRKRGSRVIMAEGVATALSFLLGAEAMKTIIAPDWHDIGMTCAILLMRAAMAVLIHWETKSEIEAEQRESEHTNNAITGGADIGK